MDALEPETAMRVENVVATVLAVVVLVALICAAVD